jgi:F-type H+-transporting ATPase subunit b
VKRLPARMRCVGGLALLGVFALGMALGLALVPTVGMAQAAPQHETGQQTRHAHMPITTGTKTTSMDAPEKNSELEAYTHSKVVQALARHLGLSTGAASRLFEDFNSGVLIAMILFYIFKKVPGIFRTQRKTIEHDLVEARSATADAEARLRAVELKLAGLNGEVEALRKQALENNRHEEERMHASLEEERDRIVRSAQAEIHAAQTAAERGLRRYAADLAVDRAAERVRLSEDGDRVLVDDFLKNLAGTIGKQRQN